MNTLDQYVAAYSGDILYDFDNNILLNWYSERILELAGHNGSILELGLGHGHATNKFSQHFKRHLILEGSSAVIDNFKKKYPSCDAEVLETLFERFETEEQFDLIVLGFILEHVDHPVDLIKRFLSFLKPDGSMFVAVPNAETLNRRLGQISGLLSDITALSEHDYLLGHKRFYTLDTLLADIADTDCKVRRVEGIYLKPFTTKQMLSLNLDRSIISALCEVGVDYPELSCGLLVEVST